MPFAHGALTRTQLARSAVWGAASIAAYFLLYLFEEEIIALVGRGGWYFLLPVATAFLFSYLHGTFTGYFWDILGIKAKK